MSFLINFDFLQRPYEVFWSSCWVFGCRLAGSFWVWMWNMAFWGNGWHPGVRFASERCTFLSPEPVSQSVLSVLRVSM
jgi:hypothetical protein